jgi:hypothetical protein
MIVARLWPERMSSVSMHAEAKLLLRASRFVALLLLLILAQRAPGAQLPAGKVVWWSQNPDGIWGRGDTNGVVVYQGEVLGNVVALAACNSGVALLRSDGDLLSWRPTLNDPCAPLTVNGQPVTNVAALSAYGGGVLAFRHDGTVVGCDPFGRNAEVLPGLTNVIAVARVTNGRLLALRKDGTLLCQISREEWEADGGNPNFLSTTPASLDGHLVTNVVALAEDQNLDWSCLAVKRDGSVLALCLDPRDFGFADFSGPTHPLAAHPLTVHGEVLTNILTLSCRGGHYLALKSDGTAAAWGFDLRREALPPGLRSLAAVVQGGDGGLALRRDGTVVRWGIDTNVPAGLGGVIAIAPGLNCYLALTTNAVLPSSVSIPRRGD